MSNVNIDSDVRAYPETVPSKSFRSGWEWSGDAIVVNWTKYRTEWRKTASMSRADFVNAAADLGIMTDAEAIDGARGVWPASFEAALSGMMPKEQREAKVEWGARDTILRSHPLIAVVGAFKGLTDPQIDDLFGYDGQE